MLIATRALMGVGGALIMPATLSIITNIFPTHERGRAIGIWAGVSGVGIILGPLAGGWLLEHFWWGSVFFVNVPIIATALVYGWFVVPDSRDPAATPLDPVGALLSIGGLVSLVYGIIEAPSHGWTSASTLTALGDRLRAAGRLHLVGAALRTSHAADPVLRKPPLQRSERVHHPGLLRTVRDRVPLTRSTCSSCSDTRRLQAGVRVMPVAR